MPGFVSPQQAGMQPVTVGSTTAQHTLGDVFIANHNAYTYAVAGEDLSASTTVDLDGSYEATAGTDYVSPAVAVATGEYFWAALAVSPF